MRDVRRIRQPLFSASCLKISLILVRLSSATSSSASSKSKHWVPTSQRLTYSKNGSESSYSLLRKLIISSIILLLLTVISSANEPRRKNIGKTTSSWRNCPRRSFSSCSRAITSPSYFKSQLLPEPGSPRITTRFISLRIVSKSTTIVSACAFACSLTLDGKATLPPSARIVSQSTTTEPLVAASSVLTVYACSSTFMSALPSAPLP